MSFDGELLTPVAALLTTVPLLTVYLLAYRPLGVAGATAAAVGANLVATVSLIASPRLPLGWAVADAVVMGLAVLLGTASASTPWLHLALLVPLCLLGGIAVAYGQTVGAIGNQALIAYVVLGRFAGPAATDLRLAAELAGGALVEVAALLVLRLPPSLRHQRAHLVSALGAVADLVEADPRRSATDILSTLDDAERALAAPALFGRVDVRELRALLDQVRRARLEVTTLSGLRVRLAREGEGEDLLALASAAQATGTALRALADSLSSRTPATWRPAVEAQRRTTRAVATDDRGSERAVLVEEARGRLEAIGGQLRAAGQMVDDLAEDPGGAWLPRRPDFRAGAVEEIVLDPAIVREALTWHSPALRHAVRVAVTVPLAALVAQWWGLPRGYWLPFAVLVILRPDYSTLFTRGVGRVIGTLVGAVGAAALVSLLHPGIAVNAGLVALFAWISYATWSASFAASVAATTALIVTLLTTGSADALSTALDRLLDVSLGALLAMAAYLLWPTPARAGMVKAQSDLYRALAAYLDAVGPALRGRAPGGDLATLSRTARVAWARAEAAVGRALDEPSSTRLDPSEGRQLLALAMRVLRATHATRLEVERGGPVALSGLDQQVGALAGALREVAISLDEGRAARPAALRDGLRALEGPLEAQGREGLAAHLDELVNATNTALEATGRTRGPALA